MANDRRFCCDDETGETITYPVNSETGEPSLLAAFKSIETSINEDMSQQIPTEIKFPNSAICQKKEFQSLKERILNGSNTVSYRLFLIPMAMVFPGILSIMVIILEIFLHFLCHKKNKSLDNPSWYYRSPFHVVTSIFCGYCREYDLASKVGQLQDERRNRYDYIRGMVIPAI